MKFKNSQEFENIKKWIYSFLYIITYFIANIIQEWEVAYLQVLDEMLCQV